MKHEKVFSLAAAKKLSCNFKFGIYDFIIFISKLSSKRMLCINASCFMLLRIFMCSLKGVARMHFE